MSPCSMTSRALACSRCLVRRPLVPPASIGQALRYSTEHFNQDEAHANVLQKLRSRDSRSKVFDNFLIVDTLRECYPKHMVTQTEAASKILRLVQEGQLHAELDKSVGYYASRERNPQFQKVAQAGLLRDQVEFGRFNCRRSGHEFYIYVCNYAVSEYDRIDNHYIVFPAESSHQDYDPVAIVDELLTAALKYDSKVSEEIWLYDEGYWSKNHKLWKSVAKCSFDQVILKETMKKELTEDLTSFFDQEHYYASFGVPWKRGVIFHGLPGNGKTLFIKALMRALSSRQPSIPTLYVKSLGRSDGQDSIRDIFSKARDTAPCLLVFEDLDSLVSTENRSFFLNEIDGIEENNGIMILGSTNHLDKLDVGISKRPSRFDRKYHFALPGTDERARYCDVWRSKLAGNTQLNFPAELSTKIANISEGLSYAYLQEVFVASLTSIIRASELQRRQNSSTASGISGDLPENIIWLTVSEQIEKIKKEMRDSQKSVLDNNRNSVSSDASSYSVRAPGFAR